jgi:hypothetical protein
MYTDIIMCVKLNYTIQDKAVLSGQSLFGAADVNVYVKGKLAR